MSFLRIASCFAVLSAASTGQAAAQSTWSEERLMEQMQTGLTGANGLECNPYVDPGCNGTPAGPRPYGCTDCVPNDYVLDLMRSLTR